MPRPPRDRDRNHCERDHEYEYDADELLRCADVLGSFGVTAAEIKRVADGGGSLEAALAAVLSDGRDRTTVLRRMIAGSSRGLACSARYADDDLNGELTAVFEAVDWSVDHITRTRDRMVIAVTDHQGRRRETTVVYPDTPLGTDNLPAILQGINTSVFVGTDARFVLLSAGIDRWRAALVNEDELASLRDKYGTRIAAVGRPLLPEHELEAFVPDADSTSGSRGGSDTAPWPDWATERHGTRRYAGENGDNTSEPRAATDKTRATSDEVSALIEEAEEPSERPARTKASSGDEFEQRARTNGRDETPDPAATTTESDTDGFELCGGSPSVSRVSDEEPPGAASDRVADRSARGSTASDRTTDRPTENDSNTDSAEFGTLSGTSDTARVSNDSFGTGDEWESEDDRYSALGLALGAGGNVTVRGLLEDDDFLPELPAVEPEQTRIEFDEEFDPGALPRAKTAAEQSGFVWVDSGTLETTRVSNG
ncbi:hypothetical protein ACLI4Z_09895 [Natrialbaceae archaeon A-arb3/5]